MGEPVRPTERALRDLGLGFPPLTAPLHEVEHPLIEKAQGVPDEVQAGGAERIRSLADRVWFKVKTSDHRGAAGLVNSPADSEAPNAGWWLVAAGHRQADTRLRDFYDRLAAECRRRGKGSGRVSTDGLLPTDRDHRRLTAELATLGAEAVRRIVREAIARSAHDGQCWQRTIGRHTVGAVVQSLDGDTYLSVTADGWVDPGMLALFLTAVPGLGAADWMPEPGPVLGIEPGFGQLVFSAMLPPEILARILNDQDGSFL